MPSPPVGSGLVELFYTGSFPEAPWHFPTWQQISGVRNGLFPSDDADLPAGMTRADNNDIKAFFTSYSQHSDKKRAKYLASSVHPGKKKWNNWVSSRYPSWNIHDVVIKALREADIHPSTILMRQNDLENAKATWPSSLHYIPAILDNLGMKLFGEEAFPPDSEVLLTPERAALTVFAQRAWNTTRVQLNNLRTHRNTIEAVANAAFEDLKSGKPTKTTVRATIRAVAKWRDACELFSTAENSAKAQEMLGQLQTVMEGLGVTVEKRVKPKAPSQVSEAALKSLASATDVSDLAALYHDYFELALPDEGDTAVLDVIDDQQALNDTGGDFGMEVECRLSTVKLLVSLSLTSGLPPIFNTHRHRTGMNAWDNPSAFSGITGDDETDSVVKFTLHWHQIAGLHSIARSIFTAEPAVPNSTGVLVGDEVGLGKTAQAIALIAFLNMVIPLQQANRQLPRLLRDRPYLGAVSEIQSLPHVIVAPATLVAQWVSEIKSCIKPATVDIFIYEGTTEAKEFWAEDGPFNTSKHAMHNRIIVASHTAIIRDMTATHKFAKKKKKGEMPWDMPPVNDIACSIYNQDFLTVIVDEAHNFRNHGKKHTCVLRLLKNAVVRLPMTATPLLTSSKACPFDVGSMLRLTGLPHFFTMDSAAEEKEDASALRRAKKLDDDGQSALEEQLKAVTRLQNHSVGHFLRRTPTSVDYEGKPLVSLPPFIEIIGILAITDKEKDAMEKCNATAKALIECSESGSPNEIKTTNFYNDYRVSIVWARENPGDPFPSFKTLEEWEKVKTTKLDVTARVCQYYLSRDDVEDVTFVDGHPVFKTPAPAPGEVVERTRRMIIFAHFSSMAPLLQNILKLYGVDSLAVNGKIPMAKRDKIVAAFYDDTKPARVIIISSVGAAGLNLARADSVIFFDQPWSAQEASQTTGRAWRQPQKRVVKVIHLLAEDSADLVMNAVARGKKDMYDAFVDKEKGEELRRILGGVAAEQPASDNEAPAPAKKGKKKATKTRAPIQDDDIDDPIEIPEDDVANTSSDFNTDLDPISDGASSAPMSDIQENDPIADEDVPQPRKQPGRKPIIPDSEEEAEELIIQPATSSPQPVPPTGLRRKSDTLINLEQTMNSTSEIPPSKRPRQGTISEDGRANIISPICIDVRDSAGVISPPGEPRPFLVPRAEQAAPPVRPTDLRTAAAAAKIIQARKALAASSAKPAGPSSQAPRKQQPASSAGPSRVPGRLEDIVSVPPKSALMGFRPEATNAAKKMSKKK